jgi:serine protease inhibitor
LETRGIDLKQGTFYPPAASYIQVREAILMKKIGALAAAILLLLNTGAGARAGQGAGQAAAFSWRLLGGVTDVVNPVVSPLSVYLALGMAALGAGGNTQSEFEALLGIKAGELAAYCGELAETMRDTGGSTALTIADSIWVDDSAKLTDAYAALITEAFKAEVFHRDLSTDAAKDAINAWVSDTTRGLIPGILYKNLSPDAVFALINTLYFKAAWSLPFRGEDTREQDFHLKNGSTARADFLRDPRGWRQLIRADGAEGILLPYDDGKTAFIALRPTDGRSAAELARGLTPEVFAAYRDAAQETLLYFAMPKFTMEYSAELSGVLESLGLRDAFDPDKADFSSLGTCDTGNIYISAVLHKVKMEVNEKGTEAAAATAIIMEKSMAMQDDAMETLVLDSPYVYAVLDLSSGVPLFAGIMNNPAL